MFKSCLKVAFITLELLEVFIEHMLFGVFLRVIFAFLFVLWRTINLGWGVIGLTSKCEAGIMFN
jgi:uncharacterized membrane protein YagU involved in acid resistance